MALGIEETTLIAIFIESLLYGLSALLYMAAVYVLFWKRSAWPLSNRMLAAATTMFILSTTHLAIDLQRVLNGFIRFPDRVGGAPAYFGTISDPLFIFKNVVYYMQTIIGDSFVVYRLYIVWAGHRFVFFLAFVLLVGSAASGMGILVECGKATATTTIFQLSNWIVSFFTLTLAVNFCCTCLIAGRIWWINRSMTGSRNLIPVIMMIVESGAIYSVSLITLLSVYLSGSVFQYAILDAITPIIAIVFTLIIVRVGLGLSNDEVPRQNRMNPTARSSGSRHTPTQPIAVHMTKVVHHDHEPVDELSSPSASVSFPGDDHKRNSRDEYEPAYTV